MSVGLPMKFVIHNLIKSERSIHRGTVFTLVVRWVKDDSLSKRKNISGL